MSNAQRLPDEKTRHREATISYRAEDNTIEMSFSSDKPVSYPWGNEILVHSKQAVNMERAKPNGLPLLINHDRSILAGRIRNFRLGDDGKTRGDLDFDEKDPEVANWARKMREGYAIDSSIAFEINETRITENKDGPDTIEITRWTPLEGSIVSVQADTSVGIGRQFNHQRENTMSDESTQNPPQDNDGGADIVRFTQEYRSGAEQGRSQGADEERQRQSQIRAIFGLLRPEFANQPIFREYLDKALNNGTSQEIFQRNLFELMRDDEVEPASTIPSEDRQTQHISAGQDSIERFRNGIAEALEVRWGFEKDPQKIDRAHENEFFGLSLLEMGRHYLGLRNVPAGGLFPNDVAGQSISIAGVGIPNKGVPRGAIISHNISDFAGVLANIAYKFMGRGYTQAGETWRPLVRVIPLSDYKEAGIPSLTAFDDLEEIPPGGEYKAGTMGDVTEPIKLSKFGRIFSISREAILNDDMNMFSRIPMAMGAAAARKLGDLFWTDIVLGNPALTQDSTPVFDAAHDNLGTPAAPNVLSLDEGFAKMGLQKDPSGKSTLNPIPRFICVPKILEGTARVLTSSISVQSQAPGATTGVSVMEADNRFSNLEVVAEPRLGGTTATNWFLMVDPNSGLVDTVVMGFLNGQETPFMEQEQGFTQDGIRYKVRLEAKAAPVAYQGMFKNAGA